MKWQMLNKVLKENQSNTNSRELVNKRIIDCSIYSAKKCNLYNVLVSTAAKIKK